MLTAGVSILVGFAILIWSADLFVDGAASIAENMGLSPIIIGLTIVSIGTSAPEILVSINATVSGSGSLAIGNAIGSNIANIGLVLGATVLTAPLMVDGDCLRKEVPTLLAVTLGCGLLVLDGSLSRVEGSLMLGVLFVLMVHMVRARSADAILIEEVDAEPLPHLRPLRAWLTFLLGLLLLIGSSRLLVHGSVLAARELGVSELIIGLTVVAIGTSLPELAATLASALRGHTEIALGNIIGSNLFNLLAVMSLPGIIDPQALEPGVTTRDYPMMTSLTLILAAAIFLSRYREASVDGHSYVGRTVGVLLVSMYALYYYLLYTTL